MTDHHYIAIDWGASKLKAFLCRLTEQGAEVLATANGVGVAAAQGQFRYHLLQAVGEWVRAYPAIRVYMAGHITSSLGWYQTPYLKTPCHLSALQPALVKSPCRDMDLWLSTGLRCTLPEGGIDVLRGEEVQILGALELDPSLKHGRKLICLPGTHTKWVWLQDGLVQHFRSSMTGELFAMLSQHSVLLPQTVDQFCLESFRRGCVNAQGAQGLFWPHQLFSVRTGQIDGSVSVQQAASMLSGLLIGADVRGWETQESALKQSSQILLAGNPQLNMCYQIALEEAGYQVRCMAINELTIAGFQWLANAHQQSA